MTKRVLRRGEQIPVSALCQDYRPIWLSDLRAVLLSAVEWEAAGTFEKRLERAREIAYDEERGTGRSFSDAEHSAFIDALNKIPNPCCGKCGPNRMDAPDGPLCHCGNPSTEESGVCGDCYLKWQTVHEADG